MVTCKKLFSIIVSICLIITSLPAESLGKSFLAPPGSSNLINHLLASNFSPFIASLDGKGMGKTDFLAFDKSVRDEDADRLARGNAIRGKITYKEIEQAISRIGRGRGKISFGRRGRNNQKVRRTVKDAFEKLKMQKVEFKFSKGFGRYVNRVDNVVYLDEVLREAFQERPPPARLVQLFAFLDHQGCHTDIFEADNLAKEFTEEAYAGLAELEMYILAGKALREKLRQAVKSDLAKQNISWDNVILDELFDLADEYDITTLPKTLEFYHDEKFTFVGEGKFVSQIVLSCRENLIPENLTELYTYLRTQERQGTIESSEVGSTLLKICENLTRRGYDNEGVEKLNQLIENKEWEELTTGFFREVFFGTAGIKGKRGNATKDDTAEEGEYLPGPNRINPDTIRRYTIGVANYILNRGQKEQGVVVARDTRIGSRRFTEEVVKVLRRKGIKVFRFEADRPIAEMALAVVELGAALGIEITAGDNPQTDNGYKISNEFGAQLFGPQKRAIVAEIEKLEIENVDELKLDEFDLEEDRNNHPDLHRIIGGSGTDHDMDRVYKDKVKDYILNPKIVQENASGVRIAYDPLYGAGRNIVYELLKDELGFDVQRYEPHSVSDGRFPGLPSNPDPAEEGILDEVTNWADTLGEIDFILGTDPDSERAAFKVKDRDGKWILLKANDVWSLLVWYRLTQLKAMKESGALPEIYKDIHEGKPTGKDILTDGYVIATWVTTDLIEAIANSFGLSTEFRPRVGFSAIAEKALDKIALPVLCERYALNLEDVLNHYKEEGVRYIAERLARSRRDVLQEIFAILRSRLLGGFEENNGISLGGHTLEKDGLLASVAVAEIAAYAKSQDTTLYELLNRIYFEYGYYATQNIPLKLDELTGNAEKKKILESLGQKLIEANRYRGTGEALKIGSSEIIEARSGREITQMDEEGYKFSVSDTDWVIPRPSETKPKIEFYGQVKLQPGLLTQENIEHEKQQADQRAEDLVKQAQEFATKGILAEEPMSRPLKESFILNFIKSLEQRAEKAGYPVNEGTKFSLLIGGHVKTSPSFRIVNYLLKLAEENVVYLPYEISSEKELEELIQILRESPRLVELVISDPYKICAVNYAEELSESAKRAQAVNNLVITKDNKLRGSMFDGLAFIYWWKNILGKSLDNKKIVHLGAGGVARAFAAAVSEEASNVEFVFSDVSGRRLYALKDIIESWGKDIKVKIIKVAPGSESEELNRELEDCDIVINGTGAGKTKGNIYAFPRLDYTKMKGKVCIDWNYRPAAKNLFLKYSQDNGATIYNALGFLITGFYYTLGAISEKKEVFNFNKLLRFARNKFGFREADEAGFEGDARMVRAKEALAECLPALTQLPPLGLIKETKRRLGRPEIPFIEQVIVILDSVLKQNKSFAWDVLNKLRDYFSVTGWGILSNAIEYHLPDFYTNAEEDLGGVSKSSRLFNYRFSVPRKDHKLAVDNIGKGDLARFDADLEKVQYLIDTSEVREFWQENRSCLKERQEELSQLTERGPPEVTYIITTDPEKLGTDPRTGLPYVTSCDIDAKEVYIHPYFFSLSPRAQLEILSHELISRIDKGIRDDAIALEETIRFMEYTFLPRRIKQLNYITYGLLFGGFILYIIGGGVGALGIGIIASVMCKFLDDARSTTDDKLLSTILLPFSLLFVSAEALLEFIIIKLRFSKTVYSRIHITEFAKKVLAEIVSLMVVNLGLFGVHLFISVLGYDSNLVTSLFGFVISVMVCASSQCPIKDIYDQEKDNFIDDSLDDGEGSLANVRGRIDPKNLAGDIKSISGQIYKWYRDMKLQKHAEELHNSGISHIEIKNRLKNLIRNRFIKLFSTIPEGGIQFLGAGSTFVAFELGNSGLVIKIPVMGTEYFGYIEHNLRDTRLKFGDRLAGTVEYLDNIKINLSKFDPDSKQFLLGRIGDDVLDLKRDKEYNPIIDSDGNITVKWLLAQRKVNRLVNNDNFLYDPDYYKGFLEHTFRLQGKEGVKRIIDDVYALLKRDAHPRGIYLREIKFSSFGYVGEQLVLFDIDLKEREPEIENMFTTGILDKLDPTGELSEYYREKLSTEPDSVNADAVLAEDLDFTVDGINTETAQRKSIKALLEERFQNPPYTISKDFNDRIAKGKNAQTAFKKILEKFNIILEIDKHIGTDSQYFHIIAEALSVIPVKSLHNMRKAGFKTITLSKHIKGKTFLKYDKGVLYIHPDALRSMGGEAFISELYKCIGQIFLSTLNQPDIKALLNDFKNINMRGKIIRKESADKGYDFIETKKGEEFMEYLVRFFFYYILKGDTLREVVNGDIAYSTTYATIRPSVRRIYDLFKFAFGWKEYNSLELTGLTVYLKNNRTVKNESITRGAQLLDESH